jgi:hypothetical protein
VITPARRTAQSVLTDVRWLVMRTVRAIILWCKIRNVLKLSSLGESSDVFDNARGKKRQNPSIRIIGMYLLMLSLIIYTPCNSLDFLNDNFLTSGINNHYLELFYNIPFSSFFFISLSYLNLGAAADGIDKLFLLSAVYVYDV